MSNLVSRMRVGVHGRLATDLLEEAADRIEALEAALRRISNANSSFYGGHTVASLASIADRALEGKT